MSSRRHSRQTGPMYLAMTLSSHAPALGRPAAVVWDRGDVADDADLEPGRLERAQRRLAARARPLHVDLHVAHPVLLRLARRLLGRELRGERRRLARALEAARPRRGPGHDVPGHVGDRHDRVVERRADVRDSGLDVLLDLALGLPFRLCHSPFLSSECWWAREPSGLLLGRRGALLLDRLPPRPLARAGIRVRALAADRQPAAVAQPAIAAEVHQPLDRHRHVAPQIALDLDLRLFHRVADASHFLLVDVIRSLVTRYARLLQQASRRPSTDPVDVRQRDLHPLVAREVDACDACHVALSSSSSSCSARGGSALALLVARVGADDAHHALPPDHLALGTDLLDRRSYLHRAYLQATAGGCDASCAGLPGVDCGRLSTHGPSSVMAMVCSKCADSLRSLVTAVHLSSRTSTSWVPAFTIGSMAITS